MLVRLALLFPALLVAASTSGCRRPASVHPRVVRVWCHQGQEAENKAMRSIVDAFNRAHATDHVAVDLTFFPDFQFTEKIAIAAAAHDLPDAFDIDGPLVARYVAAGLLAPLDPWFDPATRADFLPTVLAQGTIDHRLYAVGAFDSALVLYYDRELLARAGVAPPANGAGWTWPQFTDACQRLLATGITPVALHMNETADEWFTYAFTPVVWSGGGALISPDGRTVTGVLASAPNVHSLTAWQRLFEAHFASADPVDPDPFDHGAVAMDWSGHWMAGPHVAAKGARLGAMPLPAIGAHAVAPCGSWCWGMSAQARDPTLAALWLRWVTDTRHGVIPIVRANGAVPARRSAFAAFPDYSRPPYAVFRTQLETIARPRPHTPYYAALTRGFAAALRDIAHGADVSSRLRMAETEIQRVIDRRTEERSP